jgi:hypothetical protein
MRPFVVIAIACFALPATATPLIEVFAELFFQLPDVSALAPDIGDSYAVSDFVEFDEKFLVTVTGSTGDAVLGIDVDLHATGINRNGPDTMSSWARVMLPFDLITRPPPFGSWQGSGPLTCHSQVDLRCRVPITFGETFELHIKGELRHSYSYYKMVADQEPFPLVALHEFARITLTGNEAVLRQTDTGQFLPVDGAMVSVTQLTAHSPEPATAVLLLLAVSAGWVWRKRRSVR